MALITETIYSKIEDKDIQKDVVNSQIWKNCEHPLDVENKNLKGWFEYKIKFDGTTPVQCIKIKKLKK